MKKITALAVQKKNSNRVNVYLDGEFAFGVARITAAWLKNGDELSDEKIAQLLAEDAREWAYQQALLFLSYRVRSEKEVRQNLRKHEVPAEVVEETLARLRQAGLVNETEFAQVWVENRNAFRPRSRRALEMELRQKGLDDEAIQTSLANVDEEALAYAAALKRAVRFKNLDWEVFRKKLSEFLARRGFSYATVAPVVSKIWNETRADDNIKNFEDEDTA
jgi:regulatory protein